MIKVFLFRRCRVPDADRIPKIIAEDLFYFLRIMFQKCLTESFCSRKTPLQNFSILKNSVGSLNSFHTIKAKSK